MMDENISKQMKSIMLEIAKEFKRVCEQNNLTYFLCYGSLLGAVRHKGFIPWDDDMDFLMPRKDYEILKKNAAAWLSPRYRLRTMDEKDYIYFFMKIDDTDTTLKESYTRHNAYKGGVYIDIFPLDGLPKNPGAAKSLMKKIKFKKIFSACSVSDSSSKKRGFIKRTIIRFSKCFNGKKMQLKLDETVKKYPLETSEWCWNAFDDLKMPTDVFLDTADYVFEDTVFKSVKDSDKLLKSLYGDYMRLPDEKDRVSIHAIDFVDLNKSYYNEEDMGDKK